MARLTARDRVLARFLRALDRAANPAAVVDAYAARFPRLAAELNALAADRDLLHLTLSPPPRALAPGDRLGPFEVVRAVGPGGMGEVYEARDPRLGRAVALKVIRRGHGDPAARSRFAHEQEALARLHHTHIVPIHAAGEDGEVQYYAMAFLRGATLARVIDAAYDIASAGRPLPDWKGLVEAAPASPPARPRDPSVKIRLPLAYYRQVADLLAQAAEAVGHAHAVGVGHRDLKPSNLMADAAGHCWVIDFGLAAVAPAGGGREPPDGSAHQGAHAPRPPEVEGTPPYMAPEQHDGRPLPASDVWGLGATLYELLTLRRAFDGPTPEAIARAVREADPRPPRNLAPNCPPDLAAICLKALRKDPAERYDGPAALADDLRRWLNREPTAARPGRPFRPVALWAARNKRLAAALAVAVVAAVGLGVSLTAAAEDRRAAAEERRKDGEVGRLLLESTNLRMAAGRTDGWSKRAWEKVTEAARLRPGLAAVRDEAAATLVGLDAELVTRWDEPKQAETGWRGVAFSPSGRRVVSGGTGGRPTWLLDRTTEAERTLTPPGGGPVGFRGETAVQVLLPTAERPAVVVWDLDAVRAMAEFPTEPLPNGEWVSASLTPDAKLLAAGHSSGFVAVWDITTGALVRRIDVAAVGVALGPDGERLAVGGMTGEVTVWPLPAGDPLPAVRCGRTPMRAVALGPGLVGGPRWRLAAGDDGGTVCAWDEARPGSVVRFLGTHHEVLAVAFSPDGMTLASAGRVAVKLWNLASDGLLLDLSGPIRNRYRRTGLGFSPDGTVLAAGSITPSWPGAGGVDVWHVQNGRGVRSLRGLPAQVSRVWLSPDGTRLAALSHGWQVAVWEFPACRLLARLDLPPGWSADNAGLAFGPGNRRIAFSAGTEAGEWDLATGCRVARWDLPTGLCDALAWHPDGGLFLFRKEFITSPEKGVPQIGRLRELRPGGRPGDAVGLPRLVREVTDFATKIETAAAAPDGRYFVVNGQSMADGPWAARAYDSRTGSFLWHLPLWDRFHRVVIDPGGAVGYVRGGPFGRDVWEEIALPGGRATGAERQAAHITGRGGRVFIKLDDPDRDPAVNLHTGDGSPPLASLRPTAGATSVDHFFTPDGRFVVWGNADGSVMSWDLDETRRQLGRLGLGW